MYSVSRRDLVLGAAGAYAAFGINRPVTFIGAAFAEESVTQPFRKYEVGDIEVFSLIDGVRLPLRGMVRNVGFEQVTALPVFPTIRCPFGLSSWRSSCAIKWS
jgi:hypothetical protein